MTQVLTADVDSRNKGGWESTLGEWYSEARKGRRRRGWGENEVVGAVDGESEDTEMVSMSRSGGRSSSVMLLERVEEGRVSSGFWRRRNFSGDTVDLVVVGI